MYTYTKYIFFIFSLLYILPLYIYFVCVLFDIVFDILFDSFVCVMFFRVCFLCVSYIYMNKKRNVQSKDKCVGSRNYSRIAEGLRGQ